VTVASAVSRRRGRDPKGTADVLEAARRECNRAPELRDRRRAKLRHTFASILVAIDRDPTYVMAQPGHADPAFTLRVYGHMMRRSEPEREALKALVEGRVLPGNSQGTAFPPTWMPPTAASEQQKS
jgi:integrase